ncbi:MAG: hypothetical protein PHF17_08420 [Arcobacteraceae bacterium]|nr:hypothetical protein [Arcobacteraceae bacterium]
MATIPTTKISFEEFFELFKKAKNIPDDFEKINLDEMKAFRDENNYEFSKEEFITYFFNYVQKKEGNTNGK